MRKKNIFIPLSNKKGHPGLWPAINIIGLLPFVFIFAVICSCGKEKGVDLEFKTNSPPVITSVKILPENPDINRELSSAIEGKDPDRDPVTYRYQWIKNDKEIAGEQNYLLKNGNFKKGDLIQVKVTPSDGKVNGKPFLSGKVKILNSPPVIQEIWIEPKVAYANDQLRVSIKASDMDGDFIYYTYQWEKNGVALTDEKIEVLEGDRFKRGDSIIVTVTPDDREILGTPKKSLPIIISNSPPDIISAPPTSLEKNTYIYQIKVIDPDKDPIIFILKNGPKGMEIDKNTGLIQWEIQKEDKGVYSIEIEASDNGGGRSIQQYTLTVDFK